MKEAGRVMAMGREQPALGENRSCVSKMAVFARVHECGRGRGGLKTVNVLTGQTRDAIAGECILKQHHVCLSTFWPCPAPRLCAMSGGECQSAKAKPELQKACRRTVWGFIPHTFHRCGKLHARLLMVPRVQGVKTSSFHLAS
eukprot:6196815-Pleurochrysis_carterae.AAC.2